MKSLLGKTPNGAVSYISDPDIVKKSGYLGYIQKGNVVTLKKTMALGCIKAY